MNDQNLRDLLKKSAPRIPEASPYEYQAILRRIRAEEDAPRIKT